MDCLYTLLHLPSVVSHKPFALLQPHYFTTVLIDAQLKVKTPHRPRQAHQPLDKHGERISHLATHWDNDGVRQRVCVDHSRRQKLALSWRGLWRWGALYLAVSERWSLNRDVIFGSTQCESGRLHVYGFPNSLFGLLIHKLTDTMIN